MPIYEQGYRHLTELRRARALPFVPILQSGMRLFFSNRRMLILTIAAWIPFFLFFFALLAPHMLLPGNGPELTRFLGDNDFLSFNGSSAYIYLAWAEPLFVLLMTALAGGGLVANDLRANALELYFSRPLDRWHYLAGKLSVVVGVLFTITLAPCVVLWLVDYLLNDGDGHAARLFALLPRVVAACLVVTVPYGLLILALSSLAGSARIAMTVFAAIVLVTSVMAKVLEEIFSNAWFGLLSPASSVSQVLNGLLHPNLDLLAGMDPERAQIATSLPPAAPFLALLLLCAACVTLFLRRVRAVEVVAS